MGTPYFNSVDEVDVAVVWSVFVFVKDALRSLYCFFQIWFSSLWCMINIKETKMNKYIMIKINK